MLASYAVTLDSVLYEEAAVKISWQEPEPRTFGRGLVPE